MSYYRTENYILPTVDLSFIYGLFSFLNIYDIYRVFILSLLYVIYTQFLEWAQMCAHLSKSSAIRTKTSMQCRSVLNVKIVFRNLH